MSGSSVLEGKPKSESQGWTSGEVEAFLSETATSPQSHIFDNKRDRALSLLMLRCGLGKSEAVGPVISRQFPGLRVSDIDLTTGRIHVRGKLQRDGKHSESAVYADEMTLEALRAWFAERSQMKTDTDHFFIDRFGCQPYHPHPVNGYVLHYAMKAGIPREKAHPDALRQTFEEQK